MSTTIDIIEGTIIETADGYETTRVAIVRGVSGSAQVRQFNALNAPGVPRLFEQHPAIPGVICFRRQATPQADSKAIFNVQLLYRTPEPAILPPDPSAPGVVEVGASLSEQTTQRDADGNPITVSYTFPSTYADKQLAGQTFTQGGDVRIQLPITVLRETRRETQDPRVKSREFMQRVNKFPVFSGAARTYLCSRINGRTTDGGKSYEVGYEFLYNPLGWDATVVFRDPKTNLPIAAPTADAVKSVRIYSEIDFSRLRLSL